MPQELDLSGIHSEEVQDIIGRPPGWIVRRGIIVICCVVLLLLLGAWLIRYPDTVTAPVVISAVSPPVKLVARSSGRIMLVNGRDAEDVRQGQIIAVIENPAVTKDMLYLKGVADWLDTVSDPGRAAAGISLPADIQVGEVQAAYAGMFQAIRSWHQSGDRRAFEAMLDAAKRIRGQVAVWEGAYVLRSPVEGRLNLFGIWKENQYVKAGEPVCVVCPVSREYMVRLQAPVSSAGKIRAGQEVLIRMEEYPYQEYGLLRARVEGLTNVAIDNMYSVRLALVEGFRTTRGRVIEPRPVSGGMAEIITTDKSILQRIFEKL